MVSLKPITRDNLEEVLLLKVGDSQKKYVISNAESLSRAYVYSETAYPFAVYDDDIIVGFIMMGYYETKKYYTLWEFMIDCRYQNKGYGRQALKLGLNFIRDKFGLVDIYTGVTPGNIIAKKLYESVGFESTGLVELGMEEMRLKCDKNQS